VASKGRFDRAVPQGERERRGLPSASTMYRDEFMDATLDMWEIPPESAKRVGHPAPFPVALPERLINLYTYEGDLVLDPFMGSGTTAVAALRTRRHYVGYDTDDAYIARAEERIAAARLERQARDERAPAEGDLFDWSATAPRVPSVGNDVSFQSRAGIEGRAAKEIALQLLEEAGFTDIEAGAKVAGIDVNFSVRDAEGERLLIDCSGAFTSARPGLKRIDTLWKALGKSAALSLALRGTNTSLVLMSTDLPGRNSTGGRALDDATSPDGPLTAVIQLNEDGLDQLRRLAKGLRPDSDRWNEA